MTRIGQRDASLVREIALGVIRWKLLLDYNIGLYSKKKNPDPVLKAILRLTAYQIFFLNSVEILPRWTKRVREVTSPHFLPDKTIIT